VNKAFVLFEMLAIARIPRQRLPDAGPSVSNFQTTVAVLAIHDHGIAQ
jgi:hypothetical protein